MERVRIDVPLVWDARAPRRRPLGMTLQRVTPRPHEELERTGALCAGFLVGMLAGFALALCVIP